MIDLKAKNDIAYINTEKERDPRRWVSDALLIADDLINCSENYRRRLNNALKKRLPNSNRLIRTIMNSLSIKDLHSPEKNLKFCYKLTKELKIGKWEELDQISKIIAHFNA